MAEPITDYGSFFAGAKAALEESQSLKTKEAELLQEEERISDNIDAETKNTQNRIAITIKQRQKEIGDTYDKELHRINGALKKARSKKEKAKSQGVKGRIEEETRELREKNTEIRQTIRKQFREAGTPGYCNSSLFYALYFPHRFFDVVKLLAAVVLCFGLIPGVVYKLIPGHRSWYLIGIYLVAVLLFGGLYVLVGNFTKARHREILLKVRNQRDEIAANKKRMALIVRDIRNDSNEAQYALQDFDAEIARLEEEFSDTTEKKKEALANFETGAGKVISQEITESAREKMETLEGELNAVRESLAMVRGRKKELNLSMSDNYEAYLGKDYYTLEKLEKLEALFASGEASNLTEAIGLLENPVQE